MRQLMLMLLLALLATGAMGGEAILEQRRFASAVLPPPYPAMDTGVRLALNAGRRAVATAGEPAAVDLALSLGPLLTPTTQAEAQVAADLARPLYAALAQDARYAALGSALPYCYDPGRPTAGLYTLQAPAGADASTPVVIFLHGMGGSFQLYPWVLGQYLDDCIVAYPAWSTSWHNGRHGYLASMLADMEKRLGFAPAKPWLMGISTGAVGGFRVYTQSPTSYAGLVSLAGGLTQDAADALVPDMRVLMLNGAADTGLTQAVVQNHAAFLRPRIRTFRLRYFAGDHLFVLREPVATFAAIRSFMSLPARD